MLRNTGMPTRRVTEYAEMKLGFWKLKVTAGTGTRYKELGHMKCLTNLISQPSLNISLI
jgi:hypothetical protein